jgi:multiple sugar transport system ATP-binding protein
MIAGEAPASIRAKVADAARVLGLDGLLARLPRQLSGGQRQRVAMGRAMVRNPQVFLFDEPLSNLDAKLRVQMRSEIRALHQRLAATSIYVTHDQIEALTMADRIVVLRDGRVEQVGTPVELYDRPCNTFVAGFIGSPAMNLLPGRVAEAAVQVDLGGMVPLPTGLAAGADGRRVVVGLRPEHLQLSPAGAPGIACRVDAVEFTGADTLVMCGPLERQQASIDAPSLQLLLHDRTAVAAGDRVVLGIDPARVHVFDEASGQRL